MFSFKNVGKKIMALAKVFMWIGIVCSVLLGLGMILLPDAIKVNGVDIPQTANIICGIFVIVFGSICSWVSELITYGFGHLIESVDKLPKKED